MAQFNLNAVVHTISTWETTVKNSQWRIQDFPLGGGAEPLGVALTSDMGTFWQNKCENERIVSCWGGGHTPAVLPGSANDSGEKKQIGDNI